MRRVFIVGGVRTAIGSFGGSLRDVPVTRLGSIVIKEVLKRCGFRPISSDELKSFGPEKLKGEEPEVEKKYYDWDDSLKPIQIDEVIMGCVLQGGRGQNVARQSAIYAGIPVETTCFTVNKVCASGMKAVALGAQAIMSGAADIIIAGGMENMSETPYGLPKARWGYRMDVNVKGELWDLMVFDGLWEIFYGYHMGNTAENIASKYGITREEQDKLGLLSHQRARKAIKDGIFAEEIVPVEVPQRKGEPIIFDTDERPMDTSLEKMAKLPPVFKKDGTVTAGNASGINDAAAALLLMSEDKVKELGIDPICEIKFFASGGVDPAYMGLGPVPAIRKVLKAAGLEIKDIDIIELNEAFAAQAIAVMREVGMSLDNTNIYGSGISLGHPIGCTGARILVTLIHEMKRNNHKRGLATLCIGGGMGMAMLVEKV